MFWKRKSTVQGYIGAEGLGDWWLETFTKDEQKFMEENYKTFNLMPNVSLTTGKPPKHSNGTFHFLSFLALHFRRKDQVHLGLKVLDKAKDFPASVLDWHFYYSHYIELRYKQRGEDPQAISDVIDACEKMIELAPKAARAFLREDGGVIPPVHQGYSQLIGIRKKQKVVSEVQRLQDEYENFWGDS